jgi:hypothetical protein
MSAGLPGLGLGGLFFIFSALLAPFPELWRTLRGRSGLAAWRVIGRQFAQAAAMVAAIDLTLRLAYVALSTTGLGDPPPADTGTVLPLTLIGITSALLVVVLAGAKLADFAVRIRISGVPRVPDALPRPRPLRTLAIGGTAAVAWFALLAVGASELSPLTKPRGDRTVEQRGGAGQRSPSQPANGPVGRGIETRSGAAPANPGAADGHAGHEGKGNDAAGPNLQPPGQAAPPPAGPPKQSPAAAPPTVVPPPASGESGSGPPSGATPPHPTGPPATAGPPEGRAPEHAGPRPRAGPG